jgi:Domain of unknown function (DUF4337)
MEEGPEPQEAIERTVEQHHHQHGEGHAPPKLEMTLPAITAAVLAVFAAFGSLLSGHAANSAILAQIKAADQWSLYQSKSTKGHIYDGGRDIVQAVLDAQRISPTERQRLLADFDKKIAKYEADKEDPREKAEHLEHESVHEFDTHHRYATGIVAFQVGIVLASISILVRFRSLWLLSIVAGVVGIVFLGLGLAL